MSLRSISNKQTKTTKENKQKARLQKCELQTNHGNGMKYILGLISYINMWCPM